MPSTSFEDLKLNLQLLNAIENALRKVIGYSAKGDSCGAYWVRFNVVTAKTGSGQTAAFVLPILMTVNYAQDKDNSFPGFYQP